MTEQSQNPKFNIGSLIRIVGSVISTVLFVQIIRKQDWVLVSEKLTHIPIYIFVFAILCTFASYGFNVLRWCTLLWAQKVKVPYWQAYKISLGGNFASNFLPSTIGGDGFRMLAVQPYTKSKNFSIGSVVLDRVINMCAMVFLVPIPFVMFGSTLTQLISAAAPSMAFIIPEPIQKLFSKYFPKILQALKTWSQQPASFLWAFVFAWPSNILPIIGTYTIARSLGMDISFWHAVGVQTVSYFLSVLPISINGYGLREVVYTTLYSSIGISVEQASTLAIITRLVTILSTLPGALWLNSLLPQENKTAIEGE